jgi:hypothetical protein
VFLKRLVAHGPRSPAGDPMTLGNMRENGRQVARRVVLGLPPQGGAQRRSLAG